MKKRSVTILLATVITASMIAGCGAKNVETTTPVRNEEAIAADEYDNSPAEVYDSAATAQVGEDVASNYDVAVESDSSYAVKDAVGGVYEEPMAECYSIDDCYVPYVNGETYTKQEENDFTAVATNPLSTFAADVDTASYSNFRRMVTDGYDIYDIPEGSIRAEEMINYFDYDYVSPEGDDTFAVKGEITDCPWNKDSKLLTMGIKAKEVEDTADVKSNIVFLIDVSGSMSDYDKLPLLQMGFEMLIDELDENDRVSIVTYASDSDVVIAGVPGNKKAKLKKAMNSLEASGSTNGGSGIKKAYKLAEKNFIKGGNNRIIMATDGDLNVGLTSVEELEELVSNKKDKGVFLSVLGFGTGNYNESNLETLADKGNGNYSYIDSMKEAKKVLSDEFGSTLFTVAKDVKFQIEFNPAYVSEYRQIGYENRQMAASDFDDDTKDGGEMGSGHAITVMYEIKLNDGKDDEKKLRYQDNTLSNLATSSGEWMMVSVRYKEPEADESKLETYPISEECYTKKPSCDTLFATYVAETSMLLNNSNYMDNIDLYDIIDNLEDLDIEDDEYKSEFVDLLRSLQ
ncbi:MAG: VWA domain-containing protein [Lachnospiraceae bacterium]|nr:VWA domain-containing protein [Candidatus Colinaster equi]